MSQQTHPLIALYGENALDSATTYIEELRTNSNFYFDAEYMKTGISFMMLKANEMLEGRRKHKDIGLKDLVSEAFGEAAIYKFQC